jgi:hypothetical protein
VTDRPAPVEPRLGNHSTPPAENLTEVRTGIRSLDDLLAGRGIRYLSSHGYFGVIFGSAGSGKSILSLQVCCGFAWDPQNSRQARPACPCAIYTWRSQPGRGHCRGRGRTEPD